ncbi:MFS transporter, partial [Syntrophomonas wolfei]|uniref:MFS transporter n=1 Tax=Syntrophomonas wolfei TaxID=863 RepID=UPI0023F402D9
MLIIICIGIFMSTVDGSILNIANPTIARELSVSMREIQWVVTAYMLVITTSLLFFGKLGDMLGSSKIYSYGFLIFTIGSLLCSLSPSLAYLVAARVIQAIGASMMMATGIGIVSNAFPPGERGKALGITGSIVGVGNMTGPSLGGILIANFTWPVIFLINVPIGILAFYLGMRYLPQQAKSLAPKKHDLGGLLLFALSTIILLLSFSGSHGIEWKLFSLGLLIMLLFYLYEKRISDAILDLELFKIKNFSHGNLLAFAAYSAQTSVFFLMPFFLENLLHYPPAFSGLIMTIPPVTMAITAPLAGALSDRIGNRRITPLSFLFMTSAYLLLSTLEQDSGLLKVAGS